MREQRSLPKQPIQNRYSIASAKACIQTGGLKVLEVLHTGRNPALPLVGPSVAVFLARK